jgi:hypothetical protein
VKWHHIWHVMLPHICWNLIPCLIPQKRKASGEFITCVIKLLKKEINTLRWSQNMWLSAEIGCSADEQESTIKAYESSSDVIDVTSKEKNNDHDWSLSSRWVLMNWIKRTR